MELQYRCKFCNKICKKYGLKNHERCCKFNSDRNLECVVHAKFTCKICQNVFVRKTDLYEHKKLVHSIYDNGGQQPKYNLTCKYCGITRYVRRTTMSRHESHCNKNPNKRPYYTYTMSEEGRKHISEGMKLAHKEGRASSWIGKRKRSYAEQSWFNIFSKENIEFENNYHVHPYWLDFAWPDKKIYFEVDGRTHYTTEGKLHDEKRTNFLKEHGWMLIGRCNWSEYQSLSEKSKQQYIEKILNTVRNHL